MSEEAEACCFVLPLREAVAHFALRNTRSTDAELAALTMIRKVWSMVSPTAIIT